MTLHCNRENPWSKLFHFNLILNIMENMTKEFSTTVDDKKFDISVETGGNIGLSIESTKDSQFRMFVIMDEADVENLQEILEKAINALEEVG